MNKISIKEAEQIARLFSKRDIVLWKIGYLETNQTVRNGLDMEIKARNSTVPYIHEKNIDNDFVNHIKNYYLSKIENIEAELKKLGVNIDE